MRHLLAHLGEALRTPPSFADVNIRTVNRGEEEESLLLFLLPCHALVLAAASPSLLAPALAEAARAEEGAAELILAGVEADDAREAVRLLYEGAASLGGRQRPSEGVLDCLRLLGIGGCWTRDVRTGKRKKEQYWLLL